MVKTTIFHSREQAKLQCLDLAIYLHDVQAADAVSQYSISS